MRRKSKSLMQSEVFIIIMIIIALLYTITTIYASNLEKETVRLKKENFYLKEINTTCWKIQEDLKKKDKKDNKQKEELNKKDLIIEEQNQTIVKQEKQLDEQNRTIAKLNITLEEMLKKFKDLNSTYHHERLEYKKHAKPPLITLAEDKKEFRFGKGKAKITRAYKKAFMDKKFRKLIDDLNQYDCDTIEVYGYTDTLAFGKKNNVDKKLHKCIKEDCSMDKIRIHSNLELGMKRAISIVYFLKREQELGNINPNIVIKPYSAGQFINEDGDIASVRKRNSPQSRRIEIRLSRSKRDIPIE